MSLPSTCTSLLCAKISSDGSYYWLGGGSLWLEMKDILDLASGDPAQYYLTYCYPMRWLFGVVGCAVSYVNNLLYGPGPWWSFGVRTPFETRRSASGNVVMLACWRVFMYESDCFVDLIM